jgi:hypothetical protein
VFAITALIRLTGPLLTPHSLTVFSMPWLDKRRIKVLRDQARASSRPSRRHTGPGQPSLRYDRPTRIA